MLRPLCYSIVFIDTEISSHIVQTGVHGLNSTEADAAINNTSFAKPSAAQKIPQYDACYYFNPCLNQGRCISEDTTKYVVGNKFNLRIFYCNKFTDSNAGVREKTFEQLSKNMFHRDVYQR